MRYSAVVAIVALARTVQANPMDEWMAFPRVMENVRYFQPAASIASM